MRIRSVFATLVLLLLTSLPSLAAPLGSVRIGLIEGDVQTRNAESEGWVPAAINTALGEGDELWVPQGGKAELQLSDGTYVRLDYESALQILRLDPDSYQFFLSQGRAYVRFRARPDSVLQLDTPQASVHAFEPCSFDVELSGDYTDVSAYRGSVDVESRSGQTRLAAGNARSLGPDGGIETTPLGPRDAWEDWNRERNEDLLREGPSNRYLPAELRPYGADFDRGGRWVETRDYGPCWIPADASDADWAPYRSGRWVWRGGDYVWVGYEPWGWAPYHFGRWAFAPPFGWCWVPPPPDAVFWGPGFVGWVRTPDYVAWVPLAPREVYYGRGFYGRYSVDVTRGGRDRNRRDHDYRNGHVRNGVIVVHRNTFLTGAPPPVPFRPDEVRRRIYKKENMIFGRPPIDPVRASFMPIIKSIPPPFLPPPAVEKLRVDSVRRARPVERRRDDSAPRRSFVPLVLPEKPAPAPRRRLEHSPGREPDRSDRGRGEERQRDRGPKFEEPKRPPPEPAKPGKGEDRKTLPSPQTSPRQERRLEHWPAGRPEGEDKRGAGEVRPGDRVPKAEEPKRPVTTPTKPEPAEERKSSPPAQVVPPPERRPENAPVRRPEGADRGGGERRSRERAPKTEELKRPSVDPSTPDAGEERRPTRGGSRFVAPESGSGGAPETAPRSDRGRSRDRPKSEDPAVPRAEKGDTSGGQGDRGLPPAEGGQRKREVQKSRDSRDGGERGKDRAEEPQAKEKVKPQKPKERDKDPQEEGAGKGEFRRGR